MKRIILFLAVLFPLLSYSQKKVGLEKVETDPFTGESNVITEYVTIHKGKSIPYYIYGRIVIEGDKNAIHLRLMTGEPDIIVENSELLFKDANGNIATFLCNKTVAAGIGDGSIGLLGSKGYGLSVLYRGNLDFFKDSSITNIRIITKDSKYDVVLSKKEQDTLARLYAAVEEVLKQ